MKLILSAVLFALFAFPVFAQDPPKHDPPAVKPPETLPAENRAAILEIQLRISNYRNEYNQICNDECQRKLQDLQSKFQQDSVALIKAQSDALKALNLNEKEWMIDLQSLKPVKRPPSPAPPAPEKKP